MATIQPLARPLHNTLHSSSRILSSLTSKRIAALRPALCPHGLSFQRAASRDARSQMARAIPRPAVKMRAPRLGDMQMGHNFDGGFLPQSLVMDKNKPSLFTTPMLRMRYIFEMTKYRLKSLFTLNIFRTMHKNKKRRKPFRTIFSREAIPNAVRLQQEMYQAFAAGNVELLTKICCQGLAKDLISRVGRRDIQITRTWRVGQVLSRPKLLSDRGSYTPIEGTGIRQAVVRLHTRQILEKQRQGIVTDHQEQDSLEYLVLQKMFVDGEEGEWKVWGTVKETDFEAYMDELRYPARAMKALQQRAQAR